MEKLPSDTLEKALRRMIVLMTYIEMRLDSIS